MVTYQKHPIRFGLGGLDVRRAIDVVDVLNATVLTNAIRLPDGGWTSRFGQTTLTTGGTGAIHSIVRGTDPQSGTTTFLWGDGTHVSKGTTGALTSIDTGYSGNPLSFVPWQDAQSGQSWIIVGDSNKMRKVRVSDALVLPIGLAAPSNAPTTALDTANTKTIEDFESGFTGTAGTGGAPTLTYPAGKDTNCLNFLTNAGAATTGYYNFADKALNLDLSTYGSVDASDDDYIHLWLRFDNPIGLDEVKVYFVSNAFTSGTLPGTSTTVNQEAFYKIFRASDSSAILTGTSATAVAPTIYSNRLVDKGVKTPQTFNEDTTGTFPDEATTTSPTSNEQTPSSQTIAGTWSWTEWGSVGIPLRRGDFQTLGEAPDWSSIKGIVVYVSLKSSSYVTNVQFDECYLTGGEGPDTGEPGTQQYDYVYTNFDTRTGAEGNGSPVQDMTDWLDSLRCGIVVTPDTYGDADVRQRFYRRGGTLTDNWRFVGQNASDGGAFTDDLSDTEISTEDLVPTDYFQAVPSVDADGDAVLGKAVPYVWGPLQGLIFAAGDPNRPGAVYFPYPDSVDQWSAEGYINVASSTEAIIGGFILGSQAFAWGTRRLYALNVNFGGATSVTSSVTECTRAPVSPWAYTTGNGMGWFVAYDGVYGTAGGREVSISDNWIRPLFQGQTVNGLAPINLTATTTMRLAVYQNELWFLYTDTNGAKNVLAYHLIDQLWRHMTFTVALNTLYADVTTGVGRLLFGTTTGVGQTYSGTSDNGAAIACEIRTAAFNEGLPKSLKRYLDYTMDVNSNGVTITTTPRTNYDQTTQTAFTVTSSSGRGEFVTAFTAPVLSPTLSLDVAWSTASTPPIIYSATTTFEVEPPTIVSWNSLPTDHGLMGWHLVTSLYVTLRSNADVTLTVVAYDQTGTALSTLSYTLASTGGAKQKLYVPLQATKGCLYNYQLASSSTFTLYPGEITATVQPWGTQTPQITPIIGIANEGSSGFSQLSVAAAAAPGGQ